MQRSEHTVLALREFVIQGGDNWIILSKLGSHPWILSGFSTSPGLHGNIRPVAGVWVFMHKRRPEVESVCLLRPEAR